MLMRFIFFLLLGMVALNSYALSGTKVYDKVEKSVVLVVTLKNSLEGVTKKNIDSIGSGVAIKHNLVATNCHVVLNESYIIVMKKNQRSLAYVVDKNTVSDICLLKLDKMWLIPAKLRPSSDLKIGEDVYSMGNPGVNDYFSKGIVSHIEHSHGRAEIYTDVTTSFGSSGGGLFDSEGNLIGITTKAKRENRNISISESVDWIIKTLSTDSTNNSGSPIRG